MIIHHIIIGLLLYSTNVISQSTDTKIKSLNQINKLPDSINDSFSDIAVDSLIHKVIELSERYRNDENGTISDVEHMIQSDKTLPRLTRGEIIDLLENLTSTPPEVWRQKIEKSRKDYQRALMLVMPYTPPNADNFNIEDLYTKPPVTHIIGSEITTSGTKKTHNTNKHVEILAVEASTSRPAVVKRPIKPVKQFKPETNQETKMQILHRPEHNTKKEVVIKQVTFKPEITTYKPELSTRKVEITTRKQISKPTRYSNHKYPDESNFVSPNHGIKVVKAPSLVTKPDMIKNDFLQAEKEKPIRIHPTRIKNTLTTSSTTQQPLSHLDIPNDMKDFIKDVHLGQIIPMKPLKFSSQYDASLKNFPKEPTSTENVRDLLDSIGVLPQQTSTSVPDISEIADTLTPDMRDLLMSFGLLEDPNKPKVSVKSEPIITQPNTDELYISPYSYTQFKPLPDSAPSREDMQEFLAGFGLTGNSQRSAKKLKTPEKPIPLPTHLTQVPDINIEMIPTSMHGVLEDIGLSEKKENNVKFDQDQDAKETHVFNPEQTYVSENEMKRLNQLLETIKRLEKLNRTATPEDLKDLDLENIRELTKILKQDASVPLDEQNFGPDPFDFDLSPDKNEIKRQENTTTTEKSTTEKDVKEDEAKNPSLAALEESFGGNVGAAAENVDESLPPPRRTGFYYLLDWNSFLEVGEEGKNKVNIRFSPQAGDASRFLRVNVP